jgi:membrane protein DedA with SNARE-associated domain
MLDMIENTVLSTLQVVYDRFGWAGVFGLMIFENATGITPSEIILALAGWMLIERHALPPSLILLGGGVAAVGSAIGASITYWVARIGGRPVIERFARFFRMDMRYIISAEQQVHRFGAGIVLFGRVIPGVRTLVSIPAGLARMPFLRFFLATLAGAYLWCTLLVGIGYILGHEWMLISRYLGQFLPFILAAGFLALTAYLFFLYRKGSLSLPWRREPSEME